MKLTDQERETIIAQLREEAEKDLKAGGCTCEPTWTLTDKTFGPYDLPKWESDHADGCALVKATGLKGDARAVMLGSSVVERLRREQA